MAHVQKRKSFKNAYLYTVNALLQLVHSIFVHFLTIRARFKLEPTYLNVMLPACRNRWKSWQTAVTGITVQVVLEIQEESVGVQPTTDHKTRDKNARRKEDDPTDS